MSEEGLDLDLQRASAAWPRPVRVALVPPDPGWPAEARIWVDRLAPLGRVEHVGATAVPGLPAVAQLDLLLVGEVPDDDGLLEAHDLGLVGASLWRRPTFPDDGSCPTAVEVRVLSTDDPAIGDAVRFRDLLRADPQAGRRYTDVRRGLSGEWRDLAAYRRAKAPVIAALLRAAGSGPPRS
ncbi:GrpB family protein [Actinomycetospora termitidis]|uniref:GrpB family protein n=1 Tax=Actinomycetospora termitidis TaxID=3053470 RepID=A0ABT7MDK7_9PSEU|nr:GrpB family protein [Actinomycetospora sp. Odt1-22]MDL5158733.1 GrpB family protein [Actinomycetospora sp. Odt1-22]